MTRIESLPLEETVHDAADRVVAIANHRRTPVIFCRCFTEVIVEPKTSPAAVVDAYYEAHRNGRHAPETEQVKFYALVSAVCRYFHKTIAQVRVHEWSETEVAGEVERPGMGGAEWHPFTLNREQLNAP